MEEVLSYLKYNYIICFDIDGNGNIHITGSSNRAIRVEELRYMGGTDVDSLEIYVDNLFKKYFKLQLKDTNGQLSEAEREILASIINSFKTSKQAISQRFGVSFYTAQIVFILPLDWDEEHYRDKLLAFFMETEWIIPEDDKNKLILVPFIQALADYLQTSAEHTIHLDRERSSLLFSMLPPDEDDMTTFNYTRFQLQSAKELMAVSKALASSDFLLVPSIRSNKSISLENLDKVMYTAVKQILSSIQEKHSKRKLDDNTAEKEDLVFKIVSSLPYIYHTVCIRGEYNKGLVHYLRIVDLNVHQLQELKTWSCGQFTAAIFENANVKRYSRQVCEFFREAVVEYGAIRDSPDGIQHIILYSGSHKDDFRHYIMQALIDGNIIQPGNEFVDISSNHNELAPYAMQRPYKMIQVANALLPPVIVNEETQDDSTFQMDKSSSKLIRPNAFYVQASIAENQVNFILNKVIATSPSEDVVKLFTAQERSTKIEDITETASHMLWNHYQSLNDTEEHRDSPIKTCQEHSNISLSLSHYMQFSKNVKKRIDLWFETQDTFLKNELDACHPVSVDEQCNCALGLSQRLFLEVGLKPAISSIATIITSTLFSNDFFGLYDIHALIVKGSLKTINSLYFSRCIDQLLKEALQRRLQAHLVQVSLFYARQVDDSVAQYLGRGNYLQVSSTTYTLKISLASSDIDIIHGVEEDGACRKVFSLPCYAKWSRNQATVSEHLLLTKEESISLTNISTTFLASEFCDFIMIDIYVSDSMGQHRVWSEDLFFSEAPLCSPISIKLSPEHHSSTVNISISYLTAFSDKCNKNDAESVVYDVVESISIHERLFLRRK